MLALETKEFTVDHPYESEPIVDENGVALTYVQHNPNSRAMKDWETAWATKLAKKAAGQRMNDVARAGQAVTMNIETDLRRLAASVQSLHMIAPDPDDVVGEAVPDFEATEDTLYKMFADPDQRYFWLLNAVRSTFNTKSFRPERKSQATPTPAPSEATPTS